jgi:hypothetical protein
LNAPTKERLYTIAGPEFGPAKVRRLVLIVRALYGLRSSGACFHDHMAATLREGGFTACKADADVWMKAAVKKEGMPYYEYALCYGDDILAISEDLKAIMEFLKTKYYRVRKTKIARNFVGPTKDATFSNARRKRKTFLDRPWWWSLMNDDQGGREHMSLAFLPILSLLCKMLMFLSLG